MRSSVFGLVILALLGCASGGSGDGDGTVSVYATAGDVPCQYEVMRTVRAEGRISSDREFQREMERVLGRAGAGVGASAVIAGGARQVRGTARGSGGTVRTQWGPLTFEGQAVRYLDPTCGQGS